MKKIQAIQVIRDFDKKKKFVFAKHDMSKLFPEDNAKALDEGLNRLVKSGLLKRACRGIYVNENAQSLDAYVIEHIAKNLRRGEYNYVSLESMLSEYGMISQIPVDRLTVMTTGRKGTYKTPYGVIEFTHTKRSATDILDHVQTIEGRPLRVATKETALRDLRRVGRNINLLSKDEGEVFMFPEKAVVSPKGQVLIPEAFRNALGIHAGTELVFDMRNGVLEAKPVKRSIESFFGCCKRPKERAISIKEMDDAIMQAVTENPKKTSQKKGKK